MFSVVSLVLAAVALLGSVDQVEGRVNATGSLAIFLIADCATCTKDKNSIFCTTAASDSNYAWNSSLKITIAEKKNNPLYNLNADGTALGPASGASYCWAGE